MGRKAGGLYINPKKMGADAKPCVSELISLLGCLSQYNNKNEEKCLQQKDRLVACVNSQKGKAKNPTRTINHHLQRLAKSKFI